MKYPKHLIKFNIAEEDYEYEERWLRKQLKNDGQAQNTIESYCWTLRHFLRDYNGVVSPETLQAFRQKMIDTVSPATVNNRLHGLNRYLKEKGYDYRIKSVKVVPKQYIENVISPRDYKHLKRMLKKDDMLFYLLVTGMATSGARVSEILTLKTEHVYDALLDIYGKGSKARTLFLQNTFQKECMQYLDQIGQNEGYVFTKDGGETHLSTAQVREVLKKYGKKYQIAEKVMHPHGFRHLFGKMYMKSGGDLVTLASIMGHSKIETTKKYLLVSMEEARSEYNRIVRW